MKKVLIVLCGLGTLPGVFAMQQACKAWKYPDAVVQNQELVQRLDQLKAITERGAAGFHEKPGDVAWLIGLCVTSSFNLPPEYQKAIQSDISYFSVLNALYNYNCSVQLAAQHILGLAREGSSLAKECVKNACLCDLDKLNTTDTHILAAIVMQIGTEGAPPVGGNLRLHDYFESFIKKEAGDLSFKDVREGGAAMPDGQERLVFFEKAVHTLWGVKDAILDDLITTTKADSREGVRTVLKEFAELAGAYKNNVGNALTSNRSAYTLRGRTQLRGLENTLAQIAKDIRSYLPTTKHDEE